MSCPNVDVTREGAKKKNPHFSFVFFGIHFFFMLKAMERNTHGFDDINVYPLNRVDEGGLALPPAASRVNLARAEPRQKEVHHIQVPLLGGNVERRLPGLVAAVPGNSRGVK